MSKTLEDIAKQLKKSDKKVQLIYAFNGSGKTRLSREFKQLIAPKTDDDEVLQQAELAQKKILYYSAFTEDLFYWDNDLTHDAEPKLNIHPNAFTKWVLQERGQDRNIVTIFQAYTNEKLTPNFNADFSSVSFSFERGNNEQEPNIKVSKGEESNFIWSVFYSLIKEMITELNIVEVNERSADVFNSLEYVFIDDPVSSLDENHLIQLAVNLGQLIKSSDSKIKFIISTHNPLFYNVIYNEIDAKGGYILSKLDDGSFELEEKKGDSNKSFSYHLHIKNIIQTAVDQNNVQRYHFALLRNLYEKTANFLGYKGWSELLPGDKKAYASRIMNFYPHNTLSNEEIAEPTAPEKEMVGLLLRNLNTYGYWQQVEQNG
ncbi:MAG: anticodon nuclease [Methylotenera sp.]|nr:anticodon nuclease [Methylotenera sp.]